MEIPLEGDWLELLLLKLENAAVVTKKKKKKPRLGLISFD